MIPLGVLGSSLSGSGGPVTAAYQGTATTTSTALTSTFTAMPIGTPSATRTVVVGLIWRSSWATASASVTVGGIAATLDQSTRNGWQRVEFYRAEVPAGSTADIVATFTNSPGSQGVIVAAWALDAHVAIVDAAGTTTTPLSLSMDTAAGGVALGMVGYATNGPADWTGPSERFDLTTMTTRGSGADMATTGAPVTIATALAGSVIDPVLAAISYQGA